MRRAALSCQSKLSEAHKNTSLHFSVVHTSRARLFPYGSASKSYMFIPSQPNQSTERKLTRSVDYLKSMTWKSLHRREVERCLDNRTI